MKNFRLITITHKTANINHIGRYIPSVNADPKALAVTLERIKSVLQLDELLYLATCNRLTFLFVKDTPIDNSFLISLFSLLHPNIPVHCLQGIADVAAVYDGEECVRHIFEVAGSLDSLVVGEREILRQLRTAYDFSNKHKLTGDNIRLLIKKAIPTGKEVYTKTKIGENSVSVVSLAMREMLKLNPPKNARFLIVGAGETNMLVSKFLLKHEFSNFTVFNRTLKNAEILANRIGGKALPLTELATYQQPFDIIVTCTGASEPIITQQLYQNLLNGDTAQKIIIDLAVPNDVEAVIEEKYPVQYIAVEKLRTIAAQNLALRQEEVVHAQAIIEESLEVFKVAFRQRKVERAMSTVIPHKVREVKSRAMNAVFHKEIALMDDQSKETLEKIMAYIEKKYISIPISVARNVLVEELANQ